MYSGTQGLCLFNSGSVPEVESWKFLLHSLDFHFIHHISWTVLMVNLVHISRDMEPLYLTHKAFLTLLIRYFVSEWLEQAKSTIHEFHRASFHCRCYNSETYILSWPNSMIRVFLIFNFEIPTSEYYTRNKQKKRFYEARFADSVMVNLRIIWQSFL